MSPSRLLWRRDEQWRGTARVNPLTLAKFKGTRPSSADDCSENGNQLNELEIWQRAPCENPHILPVFHDFASMTKA